MIIYGDLGKLSAVQWLISIWHTTLDQRLSMPCLMSFTTLFVEGVIIVLFGRG